MSPAIISRFQTGRNIPFSFPTLATHHPRQLIISGMIALWAGRLGYYLFGVCPFFQSLSFHPYSPHHSLISDHIVALGYLSA